MLYPLKLLQFLRVLSDTKIVACVKWDTFVLCCVPANLPCRSCMGPASSCAILDASSRHYRWTFQWACSWGSYLRKEKGWKRAEARLFCVLGPSYTLVSKIRSVGNRRSQYIFLYPVGTLLQLLGWRGSASNQKQIRVGSSLPCPQSPCESRTSGGTGAAAECLFL